jgi:hypothetical protein
VSHGVEDAEDEDSVVTKVNTNLKSVKQRSRVVLETVEVIEFDDCSEKTELTTNMAFMKDSIRNEALQRNTAKRSPG